MKKSLYKKGLVLGIILLFVGITVAPGITASVNLSDVSTPNITENKGLNNDMVEITVELGNTEHTVLLTQAQSIELENLIDRTKARLDAAQTIEETVQIFDETVVRLNDFGMLPDGMSIEDAKRLVNGMDQNPRIVKKLERWFSRNQGNLDSNENFLCLIAGHTDMTFFIGPSVIPSLILGLIIAAPFVLLDVLLNILFDIPFYRGIFWGLLPHFLAFGYLNFLIWQFNPLAFGHIILLGGKGMWGMPIPARGWINTIGLNGIKNRNSFHGVVIGFTGIKIWYPPREDDTPFYLGAALMVLG